MMRAIAIWFAVIVGLVVVVVESGPLAKAAAMDGSR